MKVVLAPFQMGTAICVKSISWNGSFGSTVDPHYLRTPLLETPVVTTIYFSLYGYAVLEKLHNPRLEMQSGEQTVK